MKTSHFLYCKCMSLDTFASKWSQNTCMKLSMHKWGGFRLRGIESLPIYMTINQSNNFVFAIDLNPAIVVLCATFPWWNLIMAAPCCGDAFIQQKQGSWSELMRRWMEVYNQHLWMKSRQSPQKTWDLNVCCLFLSGLFSNSSLKFSCLEIFIWKRLHSYYTFLWLNTCK